VKSLTSGCLHVNSRSVSPQEAGSLSVEAGSFSVEAGLGSGRSLLQARGGYQERERETERQRRIKEKAVPYAPVEFKVESLTSSDSSGCHRYFIRH